jgi:hypothetical protein
MSNILPPKHLRKRSVSWGVGSSFFHVPGLHFDAGYNLMESKQQIFIKFCYIFTIADDVSWIERPNHQDALFMFNDGDFSIE